MATTTVNSGTAALWQGLADSLKALSAAGLHPVFHEEAAR